MELNENDMESRIEALNQKIPHNYLWDGFWIDSFKRKVLNVSASFDKMYYRDIMIVYKGVTFFNLPEWWRDTWIKLPFMRLADRTTFAEQFPNENIDNKHIIEWQIGGWNSEERIDSYYIVCDKVFVFVCKDQERRYDMDYKDPLPDTDYAQKRFVNRVPLL